MGTNMGQEGPSQTFDAIRRREARRQNKKEGLCHCGNKLDSSLYFTCGKCRDQVNKAHYIIRADGRCTRCGCDTEPGKFTCPSCLGKAKKRSLMPEVKQRNLKLARERRLSTSNGMIYGLSKRPWPKDGKCELCGKIKNRMAYHHWDNSRPSMGLWLCYNCHNIAEGVENKLEMKYLGLKKEIENIEDMLLYADVSA